MHHLPSGQFIPTNVLIRFEDGSESFTVPRGATLADISEILGRLSRWHSGETLSIDVRFKAARDSSNRHAPPAR